LATPIVVGANAVTGISFNPPSCSAPTLAPAALANTAVSAGFTQNYRQTLLATGAHGVVGWGVSSGTLPPGMTLDPNTGVLFGTPTVSGQFTFTVAAVDSIGCAGTRTYTLDVPGCVTNIGDGFVPTDAPTTTATAGPGNYAFPYFTTCPLPLTATSTVTWLTSVTAVDGRLFFTTLQNTGATRQGTIVIGSRVFTVIQGGTIDDPPFGFVDTPADGAVVSGSVAISGWALDDNLVNFVEIWRDPVAGESAQQVFIGYATFVSGARPDVAVAFPTLPYTDRAGWGYLLLTNMLPSQGNGMFKIYAYAHDFNGNRTLLGVRTINAVNASATAPFGAIDTPGQGATISGTAFVNFGWALTPQPKLIPIDGSTIHVLIDGVDVGTVAGYNSFRSDVSTLFPGLKNSGGPVGYRVIDTTALSEGVHTIAWIATDDHGITTGIGSRFFTVQNSAWQPSLRANVGVAPPAVTDGGLAHADATTTIPARVDGLHLGRKAESLAPLQSDRARTIAISNLQGLKLSLNAASQNHADETDGPGGCAPTYAGHLVVNGELRALPVGSSVDPAGTFYWHPGPAFFGTYQLVFVRTSCDGTQQKIPVTIRIY
jgi:hypothetical protein